VTLTRVVEPQQAQEPTEITVKMPAAGSGPVIAITPIVGVSGNGPAVQTNDDVPSLPPGFPAKLESSMAWAGADFLGGSEYTHVLCDAEKAELRAAVECFKCKSPRRPFICSLS